MSKLQILVVFSFLYLFSFVECKSQIVIDDVGDGWKSKIDSAITLIQNTDESKYNTLLKVCSHIGYWNGGSSSIESPDKIVISTMDMKSNNINDIAAAIVHESMHLYFIKYNISIPPNREEFNCYEYELRFLEKIPNVDNFLILHCKKMMSIYSK